MGNANKMIIIMILFLILGGMFAILIFMSNTFFIGANNLKVPPKEMFRIPLYEGHGGAHRPFDIEVKEGVFFNDNGYDFRRGSVGCGSNSMGISLGCGRNHLEITKVLSNEEMKHLKEGDIITFNSYDGDGRTIHRITNTTIDDDGMVQLITKGDNNELPDHFMREMKMITEADEVKYVGVLFFNDIVWEGKFV